MERWSQSYLFMDLTDYRGSVESSGLLSTHFGVCLKVENGGLESFRSQGSLNQGFTNGNQIVFFLLDKIQANFQLWIGEKNLQLQVE